MMKVSASKIFLLPVFLLAIGCTSSRGIIELNTRPPGATVYLNQSEIGDTPLKFEYDVELPSTLTIEKDGYYPEEEPLDKSWVVKEYRNGNYEEGRYIIQGKETKSWKVRTKRDLLKNEEQ